MLVVLLMLEWQRRRFRGPRRQQCGRLLPRQHPCSRNGFISSKHAAQAKQKLTAIFIVIKEEAQCILWIIYHMS
jgi:hypothetical protein